MIKRVLIISLSLTLSSFSGEFLTDLTISTNFSENCTLYNFHKEQSRFQKKSSLTRSLNTYKGLKKWINIINELDFMATPFMNLHYEKPKVLSDSFQELTETFECFMPFLTLKEERITPIEAFFKTANLKERKKWRYFGENKIKTFLKEIRKFPEMKLKTRYYTRWAKIYLYLSKLEKNKINKISLS